MHPTSLDIWNCWMQNAARSTSRRRPVTTKVEKTILVDVPVSTAYNQWTQFEDFPQFMGGVERVSQLGDDRLEWVAEIAGVSRRWEAKILEQVPDRKISWAPATGKPQCSSHWNTNLRAWSRKWATSSTSWRTKPSATWRNSRHSSSPRATPPVAGAGRSAKAPRSGPQGLSRPASPAGTAAKPTARTQSQSGRTRKR